MSLKQFISFVDSYGVRYYLDTERAFDYVSAMNETKKDINSKAHLPGEPTYLPGTERVAYVLIVHYSGSDRALRFEFTSESERDRVRRALIGDGQVSWV